MEERKWTLFVNIAKIKMQGSGSKLLIWLLCIHSPTCYLIIWNSSQHLFLFSFKIYHHNLYPILFIELLTQCDIKDFTLFATCVWEVFQLFGHTP